MAWAITNTTSGGPTGEVNSISFSFDCQGGNLLVLTIIAVSVGSLNTPTYGGVSMTIAGTVETSGGGRKHVYYLPNPASGSNTLTWSNSSGSLRWGYAVLAASGANAADALEGVAQGSDNTNPIGGSVSQASDVPSLGVLIVNEDSSANAFDANSGEIELVDMGEGDWGRSASYYKTFTGTGSKTMGANYTGSVTAGGFIMALFNGAPPQIKSIAGVALASTKTAASVANASIKKVASVAI